MASDRRFERFYVLSPARGSTADTEFFKTEPITRGEAPACLSCGRFVGMRRWMAPHHAQVVVHGESAGDFAFASSSEFLVSDAVVAALEDEGLTGLEDLEEVAVSSTLRAAPASPRRYFFGAVSLKGADIDPSRSDIERAAVVECDDCLSNGISSIRGFALEDGTWSGADVFVPRGLPGVVVVSEAFGRVAEERDFSNIELVPTERFTWLPSAV
ncbi:MAG: hypothetical protein ACK5O2_13525 [Microthrixaceae bacterium]